MTQPDRKPQWWWDRFLAVCERLHANFEKLGVTNDDYWITTPDLPHHYTSIEMEHRESITPDLLVACSEAVEVEKGNWGVILSLTGSEPGTSAALLIASGGAFTLVSREPWVLDMIDEAMRRMGKGDLLPPARRVPPA
jgi:hypothetical protein